MSTAPQRHTVLITDYAWPDIEIERQIIENAGMRLVAGPPEPAPASVIEELVREHQPSAILTNWAPVSAAAIAASANLQVVGRLGVGLDNIAVEEATRRGIWVTNVPDYCVEEVSDHALAMLLAWARGVVLFDREVKAGRWQPAGAQLRRVSTLTCGLIGFGRIARKTAQKLTALGVRVLVYTRTPGGSDSNVEFVSLDEMLPRCDAVIVHVPLTPDTKHLMNRDRLTRMRRGSLLINVSRGGVVDTQALIGVLESGHLSGAALDVLENEPDVPAALAARANVILTPHVAFTSDASLRELRTHASQEMVRVLRGETPREGRNRPASVDGGGRSLA